MSSSLKRTLSCWGRCINAKMTFLSWHGTRLVLQPFLLSMSLEMLWPEPPSPNTMHNHAVDWPHSPGDSQVLYLCYHAPKLSGFCCKTTPRSVPSGGWSQQTGWVSLGQGWTPQPYLVPNQSQPPSPTPKTLTPHTVMGWASCRKPTALGSRDTALPSVLKFGTEETREKKK